MQELVREYLNELKKKQKKRRRIRIIVMAFALVVAGSVIWSLTQAGIAMTGSAKCGMEEHTHGDGCYTDTLACGQEESAGHTHTDACWQTTQTLVCGQEESEEHVHAEACYQTEQTLVCGQEEYAGHAHTEACYSRQLACGRQEHIHTDACFTDNSADVEDASKWAAQYEKTEWKDAWGEDLVIAARQQLDYKESVANYVVAEDGSHKGYTRYGQFAGDNYTDWDASFVNFCMYYAGLTESNLFPDEKKTADWYDKFVKAEEGKNKVYLTTPAGYEPEEGDIIFTNRENEETDLQMGIISSYDKEKNEIKVIEGNSGNQVKENTYAIDDKYITEYLKISEMEQEYKKQENETAVGTTEEVNEETEETAAPEESPAGSVEKVYTDGTIIVRASYDEDAEIPAEAELIAEQITAEDHEEHYAERESEFRETLKNEKATMRALLKIGFYVDGKEVEPKSTVTITVQFLDENGLAEGKPVTVVHFADQGAEVLDGSKADNNSTTFRTESFSEFAIADEMEGAEPGESRPIDKSFEYEDEVFRISFHVTGNAMMTDETMPKDMKDAADAETVAGEEGEEIAEKYQFKVKVLEEDSEEYQEFKEYAEETKEGEHQLLLNVMKFSLFYEETELDLTDCEVTAEITPTEELAEYIPTVEIEEQSEDQKDETEDKEESEFRLLSPSRTKKLQKNILTNEESEETVDATDEAVIEEAAQEVFVSTFDRADNGEICKQNTVSVNMEKIETGNPVMKVTVRNQTVGTGVEDPTNPNFTVEYYTVMPRAVTNENSPLAAGCSKLTIIDTEKSGLNEGGNLPTNGVEPSLKNIFLSSDGKVVMEDTLTEIYASRQLTYFKAPTINYFDVLINRKTNYSLEKVLVSRDNGVTWEEYIYNSNLHFTNREDIADAKENSGEGGYVWISRDAVIRLLYKMEEEAKEFGASFYDYDISSEKDNGAYVTQEGGINTGSNYSKGSGARYAFGNANTGTNAALEKVDGVGYINVRNKNVMERKNSGDVGAGTNAVDYGYAGCAFELVDGMSVDESGKPVINFSSGIVGPENLFGNATDKEMKGKTEYSGTLVFDREGDVHTLTTANVIGAKGAANLNKFENPGDSITTYSKIWTNNFWPMDQATGKRHDPEFGKRGDTIQRTRHKDRTSDYGPTEVFPGSDDFANHNSYFGMTYQVDFELTGDYVGPLEYYFFGDDDMWVFLSGGQLQAPRLICDIGGLHSAVGEYVNLWDYLPKDAKGTYTLSFFYTERGASGSTCWMQFTLPSVSTKEPEKTLKDYGNLIVKKEVEETKDGEIVTNYSGQDEFSFTIYLKAEDEKSALADDYSYIIYNKNNEEIGSNIVDRTAIHDGSKFTLKHGDWIEVKHIPKGAYYEIVENTGAIKVGNVNYACDTTIAVEKDPQNKVDLQNKRVSGHIAGETTIAIQYVNKVDIYTLPGTGGMGIYLYMFSGVVLISAASLMTYRKKCRGVLRS